MMIADNLLSVNRQNNKQEVDMVFNDRVVRAVWDDVSIIQ